MTDKKRLIITSVHKSNIISQKRLESLPAGIGSEMTPEKMKSYNPKLKSTSKENIF